MKIGFIAHAVHRHGGMERAATEVLSRLSSHNEILIAAEKCELNDKNVEWLAVTAPSRPAVLNSAIFRRRTVKLAELDTCDVVGTIGAAAVEADVVTAQFCHAAFTDHFGGLRGGTGLRRYWQSYAQNIFIGHERHIYSSPRLKHVIAVSHGTARELTEYYNLDQGKIRVIPNAVDHRVFKPAASQEEKALLRTSLGFQGEGMMAVFVGGDWDRKGLADAVRAIGRTTDVHLVVVGNGNIEAYKKIARDSNAERRVHFVGRSSNPERWLAASDVFIFPSRYEAFSLVMIEAAACGLPLIVTRINGSEELVQDGVNGIFIHTNPDSIATPLAKLRDDSAARSRMANAAFQSSLNYTWDKVAAAHQEVYAMSSGKVRNNGLLVS